MIIGCGDVGVRVARRLVGHVRILALTSSPERCADLRAVGVVPLIGNLDLPSSLRRLAGLAQRVVHLAPPNGNGPSDTRTQALLTALRLRGRPSKLVYGSTSGVYGDCGGAVVAETRPVRAQTNRGARRVDAESRVRGWGRAAAVKACVLRIPGIYAPDREGGTPRARLLKGLPVLFADQDVYTNHIHADDLARACIRALWLGQAQRIYNVCDDSVLKMGDYFDLAAGLYGLARPPRIGREDAAHVLSPMQLSFMAESRRLDNTRMKQELRLRLRFPDVRLGLA
jgi:nucleoside-diphosphate-sugar epimerase